MRKTNITVLLVCISVFLLFIILLTLNYETNDDPLMMLISSGALTHEPDIHLIYINIIIGGVLKLFYDTVPSVNWYSSFMLFVHFLSLLFVILSFAYKRNNSPIGVLLFGLIFLFGFESLFLVKLQFTSTALMCGFTGLLCLQSDFSKAYKIICSLFFIILSFLIRKDTFIPLFLFSLTILFYNILYKRNNYTVIYVLLIITLTFFLAQKINNSDKKYAATEYYSYLKPVTLIANDPIEITKEKANKYGWTINDATLLKLFFWVDRTLFNDASITAFSQDVKMTRKGTDLLTNLWKYILDERFVLMMYLISLGMGLWTGNKKERIYLMLNLLMAVAVVVYLVATSRLPKRVSTPIFCYLVLANLILFNIHQQKNRLKYGMLIFLSVLCSYKFWCVYQLSCINKEHLFKFSNAVQDVNNNPDDLFIIVLKGFPLEDIPVFYNTNRLIKNKNLLFTGWFINTPTYYDVLKLNKLNNLDRDIINRKNIVFVCSHREFPNALISYYKEHYDITPSFEEYEKPLKYLYAKRIRFQQPKYDY